MRRERANTDLNIILLIFCCSSRMCLLRVLSSYLQVRCGTSLLSSPQNAIIFGPSSHSCVQHSLFLFSIPVTLKISSSQSELVTNLLLGIHCSPDLDLGTPPPLCSPFHLLLPYILYSLSVFVTASTLFLIYVPPLPPSCG